MTKNSFVWDVTFKRSSLETEKGNFKTAKTHLQKTIVKRLLPQL